MNTPYIPPFVDPAGWEQGGTFICNFKPLDYPALRQAITEFGDATLLIVRCAVSGNYGLNYFDHHRISFSLHTLRRSEFSQAPRMKTFWELVSLNRSDRDCAVTPVPIWNISSFGAKS